MNPSTEDVAKRSLEHKTAIKVQDSERPGQLKETAGIKDIIGLLCRRTHFASLTVRKVFTTPSLKKLE